MDPFLISSADRTGAGPRNTPAGLKQAAALFEGFFLQQMMGQMRPKALRSGLMDGGQGERMFSSLLDQSYADRIAASGRDTLGIGKLLYRQFEKMMRSDQLAPGGRHNGHG